MARHPLFGATERETKKKRREAVVTTHTVYGGERERESVRGEGGRGDWTRWSIDWDFVLKRKATTQERKSGRRRENASPRQPAEIATLILVYSYTSDTIFVK